MFSAALELTLVPQGRQLAFAKQARQRVHIYRRVVGEGSAWQHIAYDACSPFVDPEVFPTGTTLEYHVQHCTQQDDYEGHSPLVQVTLD